MFDESFGAHSAVLRSCVPRSASKHPIRSRCWGRYLLVKRCCAAHELWTQEDAERVTDLNGQILELQVERSSRVLCSLTVLNCAV